MALGILIRMGDTSTIPTAGQPASTPDKKEAARLQKRKRWIAGVLELRREVEATGQPQFELDEVLAYIDENRGDSQ